MIVENAAFCAVFMWIFIVGWSACQHKTTVYIATASAFITAVSASAMFYMGDDWQPGLKTWYWAAACGFSMVGLLYCAMIAMRWAISR
ncbi:hypothetical protein GSG79_004276 [Escherichia coli]|nr:hypothetical protein [Escherichia coli]